MPTRRHALALLAATPFVASGCTGESLPDPAAPWRSPGAGEADPRRFALAHAILAPNPHNTQPWLVTLDGADGMTLSCDLERRLPFTDPPDRQIIMGCGAFLHLYAIALQSRGLGVEMHFFPEGAPEPGQRLDARPIAQVRIAGDAPDQGPDTYFDHVLARRTNRNVYDARVPDSETLAAIAVASVDYWDAPPVSAFAENDPARVAELRDLVWRAFDREMRTAGAQEETYRWLRFGRAEIARNPDGLAIDAPMAPLLKRFGFLDLEDFLNPDSAANRSAARDWRQKADTAPAFVWLTTPDDLPTTRLIAGMAYARMNLAATAAGLAMHPWSQALQEYAEMADIYADAYTLLGAGENKVQMLARVGYAEPVSPAARRPFEDHIRA